MNNLLRTSCTKEGNTANRETSNNDPVCQVKVSRSFIKKTTDYEIIQKNLSVIKSKQLSEMNI